MSSNQYHDLNAVAAFMNFSEGAWEYVQDVFEEAPSPENVNAAIFYALEKVGIIIEDKEQLLKSLPYYMIDGRDEIDEQPGALLEGPDYDAIFEELGIGQ